jgi:CRP-like cAMP-binding protein
MTSVFGSEGGRATAVPITQDVLAQLSGCTRPTANRVLRSGEQAGVIAMARGRIDIVDLVALQRRAR